MAGTSIYCWHVLYCHLHNKTEDFSFSDLEDGDGHYPLFVTWKKEGSLRGCIGNFSPMNLRDGLRKYALVSALHDPRFPPITIDELNSLECCVSLLTDFEETHIHGWHVGVHGITIEFPDPNNGKLLRATYLPEVAQEQGWTREQTLRSLVAKAGFSGSLETIIDNIRIVRYQSVKNTSAWKDYSTYASK